MTATMGTKAADENVAGAGPQPHTATRHATPQDGSTSSTGQYSAVNGSDETNEDRTRPGLRRYLRVWRHDHWFWPYLKQNRVRLTLIFLLGALTFVCGAGLMFTSGFLISRSARHPYNILMVYVPIVLTRAFGLGRPTFTYLERIQSHNWVLHVVSKLRVQLYRTLSRDAAFLTEHERTGSVLGVLADDLDHLENFYLRTIFPAVVAYIMWVAVTVAVGVFSWPTSALMFLLLALVLVLAPMVSLGFADGRYHREKVARQEEYTRVTEGFLGLSDWVITHRSDEFAAAGASQFTTIAASRRERETFERHRNLAIQLVFGIAAVGLIVGSALFLTGTTAHADFAAAVVLSLFPLIDCFIVVAQAAAEIPLYTDSLSHLNALTDRVESHRPVDVPQRRLDGPVRTIDFDHVTFAYTPDDPPLLDDFTLHITTGQKVALLGPSGEGKTTILQLLLGDLLPQSGEIRVNGIPVRALQDARSAIFGYLNQAPFVFNTTIAANIRLGVPEASDARLWKALEDVRLDAQVKAMPGGLDAPVDESGQRLSGGQRQRLALARILVKDTPVILLDEPTIGLDPITERDVMTVILRASASRTLLWVTHHLQGLEQADCIVFLEHGRIVMQGKPAELYRMNARFRALYRLDVGESDGD
ncbi:MAG: thiol reductant ABC exporter subunit CydC [Bifidobacterium mongoliense]|nr:thiol reductant ABC exporter subunit CydC [Bifidobacterium mongoliense]